MAIQWDGDILKLIDQAPQILPEVEAALKGEGSTYIDFTQVPTKVPGASGTMTGIRLTGAMGMAALALAVVGIVLIVKGRKK